jgi:hypothetical protein
VLRLKKALYGLRHAPRAWNVKLDGTLSSLSFTKCNTEHALYTRRSRRGLLIVGVYVDDLIVTGESEDDAAEFKREMMKKFKMSDLGVEVEQQANFITMRQSSYARKLVERGGLGGCKPCQTPMEEKLKLSKESTAARVNATDYRSMIGGLRYLTHTRGRISDLQLAISANSWRIPGRTTPSPSKDSSATWLGQSITESCTHGGRGRSCS